jgi:hypothetical protein
MINLLYERKLNLYTYYEDGRCSLPPKKNWVSFLYKNKRLLNGDCNFGNSNPKKDVEILFTKKILIIWR